MSWGKIQRLTNWAMKAPLFLSFLLFLNVYLFILRERETERVSGAPATTSFLILYGARIRGLHGRNGPLIGSPGHSTMSLPREDCSHSRLWDQPSFARSQRPWWGNCPSEEWQNQWSWWCLLPGQPGITRGFQQLAINFSAESLISLNAVRLQALVGPRNCTTLLPV